MKYLKTFENKNKFKVGDYVVVNNYMLSKIDENLSYFLENTIGVINNISSTWENTYYEVKFVNIPIKILMYFYNKSLSLNSQEFRLATEKEIEELKLKNDVKKYNL